MSKYNKYDYCVIILITLLAFGGLGGAFQPIRILTLLTCPLLLFKLTVNKINGRDKYLLFMLAAWLLYAVFSLSWTPAPDEGAKQIVYYLTHFLMLLQLVFWYNNANKPTHSVVLGWLFAAGVTLPIALYEIASGNHVFQTFIDSDAVFNTGFEIVPYRFASTTFGDLNSYSIFLCYAVFFMFSGLLLEFSRKLKFIFITAIFATGYALIVNSSRGALLVYITVAAMFFATFIASIRSKRRGYSGWIIILSVVIIISIAAIYSVSFLDLEAYRIFYRFTSRSVYYDDVRMEIYTDILKSLPDYYFFGSGAGSEIATLENIGAIVASSHNLFLEILLQYGILILFIFVIFITKIAFGLYKGNYYFAKFLGASFAFGLIPLSLVMSGYLLHPSFWIFLGSLYAISKRPNFKAPKQQYLPHENNSSNLRTLPQ